MTKTLLTFILSVDHQEIKIEQGRLSSSWRRWARSSSFCWCCTKSSIQDTYVTAIFEGSRRVVSIWNFVRLYGLMMGSRNKILGLGGTSYPTYLDPLVPIFGIFSLWRPVTSVKMKGNLANSYSRASQHAFLGTPGFLRKNFGFLEGKKFLKNYLFCC